MAKKNNELPYMPVIVREWLSDRPGLSLEEFGALVMARLVFWDQGGRLLTVDQVRRYVIAGKRWGAIKANVLDRLTVEGGMVSCPSILERLSVTRSRRVKAAKGGHAKAARAGTSEGGLNASYEGGLNASKPLKSNRVASPQAAPEHVLGACNQNQNKNITPSFSAAARSLDVGGVAIVARCMVVPRPTAKRHLDRWSKAVGDDEALLTLLETHDAARHRGQTFDRMVTEAVNRMTSSRIRGGVQRDLPLPPVAVGGRK